jgi:hypothetical protein
LKISQYLKNQYNQNFAVFQYVFEVIWSIIENFIHQGWKNQG